LKRDDADAAYISALSHLATDGRRGHIDKYERFELLLRGRGPFDRLAISDRARLGFEPPLELSLPAMTLSIFRNCPGWGLGSEQAEGIRQGCRIAGQGVDDGPALLLGG
jgi:hypothetical protein